MRFFSFFLLLSLACPHISKAQASFIAPDTVCVNTPVNIANTSAGATTNYWNFCVADINSTPTGTNLGNVSNMFNAPVFMDYVFYNGNYHGFLTNYNGGNLIRLDFGNSLLNAPTAINLGNFGGIIPPGIGAEGIQMVYNENRWYAIIVGGWINSTPRILKIDFGSNITNPSPIATNWGNIGNMLQPIDLHVFKEGNNWYGFTVNAENNTITRFNFTNSFNNTPTAVSLGNIGNLAYPTGIYAINDNGFWRVFIVNAGNNTRSSGVYSLSRLDFGSSLLNTPTGVNLGSLGNQLQHPRDLTIIKQCGQIFGFAVNGHFNNSNIIKLNFNNDLSSTPTAISLGIIGNSSFPHSISKLFRVDNDVYGFITNVDNNTITRIKFDGCFTSSIPSSTLKDPPSIFYSTSGVYNINLSIDDGLPTQSSYCKNLVVVPELPHSSVKNLSICEGDSIMLTSNFSNRNVWNVGKTSNSIYAKTEGTYWVETTNGACTNRDSFIISIKPAPFQVNLGKDTSICPFNTLMLDAGNPGASYSWNTGATTKAINVKDPGNYYVSVKINGCVSTDTITVDIFNKADITISNDTVVCKNSTIQLFSSGGMTYQWSSLSGFNSSNQNPVVTAETKTKYYLTISGANSCTNTDSVTIDVWPDPVFTINSPASVCINDTVQLNASGGVRYTWNPSVSMNDPFNANPKVSPLSTTTYEVTIEDNCNNSKTLTTTISVLPRPETDLFKSNDVDCITPVAELEARGGMRYNWSPATNINATNIYNPIVYPHNDTWYKVEVHGQNGCKTIDSILVLSGYAGDGKFYIPNAFTPNNDGKNDCFGMKHLGQAEIFELSIYNRWGQRVFRSTNIGACWNGSLNGTPQPSGVFIYRLKLKSECTNGILEKEGFVTLIR